MPMFDKGCQTVSQRRPAQDGGSCPGGYTGYGRGNAGAGLPNRTPWATPTLRRGSFSLQPGNQTKSKRRTWGCLASASGAFYKYGFCYLFLPIYLHTFFLYSKYSSPNVFIKKASSTLTICKWNITTVNTVITNKPQLKNIKRMDK